MLVQQLCFKKVIFLHALKTCKGKSKSWIVDSTTSNHMTRDKTVFYSYFPYKNNLIVWIEYGSISKVMGKGSFILFKIMTLESIYVPILDCNLLSSSRLTRNLKCATNFYPNLYEFQILKSRKTIDNAKESVRLYLLQAEDYKTGSIIATIRTIANQSDVILSNDEINTLWHFHLGHPNLVFFKKLFPTLFNKTPYKPSQPFSLMHSDVWGSSRIKTIIGHRWFVTFINDHTRVIWIYFMKEKS